MKTPAERMYELIGYQLKLGLISPAHAAIVSANIAAAQEVGNALMSLINEKKSRTKSIDLQNGFFVDVHSGQYDLHLCRQPKVTLKKKAPNGAFIILSDFPSVEKASEAAKVYAEKDREALECATGALKSISHDENVFTLNIKADDE